MIFENDCVSKDALHAIGYKDYMSISPEENERLVSDISTFISEEEPKNYNKFMSELDNFGNPFNRLGRAIAVLDYISRSEETAEKMYKFCKNWVALMANCNRKGYFDGRNEESVKICCNLAFELYGFKDYLDCEANCERRFLYLVNYGLHRTIQQSLTDCFLIGLVASAEKLGYEDIIKGLTSYFDVEDSIAVLKEVRLPLI